MEDTFMYEGFDEVFDLSEVEQVEIPDLKNDPDKTLELTEVVEEVKKEIDENEK